MQTEALSMGINKKEGVFDIGYITNEVVHAYPNYESLPQSFYTELSFLKEKINLIKEGSYIDKNLPEVKYNKHANYAYIAGDKRKITMGEVISGMEWGLGFNVDPKSFSERVTDKKLFDLYITALTRHEVLELLNKYIYKIEKEKTLQNATKAEKYALSESVSKISIEEMRLSGILAEKMVQSLLTRLSVDNPALSFEIIKTNAYQDIDLKIDFIVRTKSASRGVEVTESKIQLTITSEQKKLDLKDKQMDKFKDVILVTMPELYVQEAFNAWLTNRDGIKSPDQFFDDKTQKLIQQKIIGGFLTTQN